MKNKKIFSIIILIIIILGIFFIYKNENSLSNSKIEWGYYLNNEKITNMPKLNNDGILFDHSECTNGASVEWDNARWGPVIKKLTKSKTKCSIYFITKKIEIAGKDIPLAKIEDGLYKVEHNDLEELGQEWNKTEYRYAGVNPDNYVSFNSEIWRIIGLVNVKTESGIEQRVKIIRVNGIKEQKNLGNYAWGKTKNDWSISTLKDLLNGIYYESQIGECYIDNYTGTSQCDFTGSGDLPKGLDETARNMIDKEVIWNLGGWTDSKITAKQFYEKERGTSTSGSPSEWSNETDVGEKHNGIGLIYPSDYGYAVGREVRNNCLTKNLYDYSGDNCYKNIWLKSNKVLYTLTQRSLNIYFVLRVEQSGAIDGAHTDLTNNEVWPVAYLKSSIRIVDGDGTVDEPFILSET